ncbi:DNA repair protein RecN [Limibaculum sp. M0105]|uniref:DNA repair protein RecN n=1 Tax=Thermohalobaculum xanthum TaxID=2753746 RepID=A0A8J7SCV0_9RHOB|nr:DNA repair protein RecN [Thermohalobaculum xanthum]MBK0399677.1 DNA repair protein RecN [Thermohalobaculum xanthum]
MLKALSIRNIVLIEALDLDFGTGLNVLTGETGAGKSILLDALGFALGRKVRRDLLMAGASDGGVTAEFAVAPDHAVHAMLDELGLAAEEGDIVIRRLASANGPARAFLNDQRVSAEALRRVGELLVEVHGQHDDRGLLDPRAHRGLLDAFAGIEAELAETRERWRAAEAARRALDAARDRLARAASDADFLRHAVAELEKLAPQPGEEEALDAERRLMQVAVRIGEEVAKAAQALSTEGAEGLMAGALSHLTHAAARAEGRLEAAIETLDRAMVELGEAQRSVDDALEALAFDPQRLEVVEERLFAIRGLARKHNVLPSELPDLALDLARRLDEIDAGEERISALEAEAGTAARAYDDAAAALSAARHAAAARLDARVTEELAPLRMEAARFRTVLTPGRRGPEGSDEVSFTAAINPGAPEGAIDRIASGGELSRFLLALKVCLAARTSGLSLVFDEIDRGVGGATADAVGRRLARLSEGAQVLVVTHSPQVAAQGRHHYRISKSTDGHVTRTDVIPVAAAARIDEIARMLAGDVITPEARDAARVLMEKAG